MSSLGVPIGVGRTAEIFAWENNCVLKLIRAEFPAHLADQEWWKAEAAWKKGAHAPRPVALVEIEGRRGVVFQRIAGQTMGQAIRRSLWRLDHYAQLLGRMHAELHRLSDSRLPSLHERVYWALGQPNLLDEGRKAAIRELLEKLPDSATLCHADFHPENILLTDKGPMIIDWEGSLHGEPDGDVAYTCLLFRSALMTGSGPRGWIGRQIGQRLEKVYLSSYQRACGPVQHLQEWLAILAACQMNEENRAKIQFFEQIVRRVIPDW